MKDFDIDNLRIASPCPMSWKEMKGDARTRHCSLCALNVHNVAGMTASEVERLVGQSNGRLCVRLIRRADGTVMTNDCPIGLRAYRRRVAGMASAMFAAVLSLFSVSYGQKDETSRTLDGSKVKISRWDNNHGVTSLRGTVVDPNGAVIPGAAIFLRIAGQEKETTTFSDSDGTFSFSRVAAGTYVVEIPAGGGFRKLIVRDIVLSPDTAHEVILDLDVDPNAEFIGILAEASGELDIPQKEIDFLPIQITPRPTKKP